MSDREFVDYLVRSNNALGERQVIGLAKIAAFCKDQNLHELRQGEIKDQCLHEWQIPNEARFVIPLFGNLQIFISSSIFRKAPGFERPHAKVESLLSSCRDANGQPVKVSPDFLLSPATSLTPENLSGAVRSAFDFKFVFLGSDPEAVGGGPAFYLGLGRTKVFR